MDTSDGPSSAYREAIVDPLREFASHTTDFPAILRGILPGITAGGALAGAFSRRLYGDRTLQDLPDEPRFVINAANLGTSSVFRFSKPYAADYRVGLWTRPSLRIADAVAASGAFPPFFAPFFIDMSKHNASFQPSGDLSGDRAYSRGLYLADGSLFDSFAMDAVYHRCHTVLVSDGAGRTQAVAEATSRSDIVRQIPRLLTLYDLRVRNQTYRNLIGAYESNQRAGTYWGMRTDITQYQAPDALPCSFAETQVLAQIPTRLAALSSTLQEGLINWGYAVSDAALRRHVVRDAPPPPGFPFPSSGLGV
jgi:NTE family protein